MEPAVGNQTSDSQGKFRKSLKMTVSCSSSSSLIPFAVVPYRSWAVRGRHALAVVEHRSARAHAAHDADLGAEEWRVVKVVARQRTSAGAKAPCSARGFTNLLLLWDGRRGRWNLRSGTRRMTLKGDSPHIDSTTLATGRAPLPYRSWAVRGRHALAVAVEHRSARAHTAHDADLDAEQRRVGKVFTCQRAGAGAKAPCSARVGARILGALGAHGKSGGGQEGEAER